METIKNRNLKRIQVIYEPMMALLALAVLVVLVIEFTRPLTDAQALLLTRIDLSILTIFAADYFYGYPAQKVNGYSLKVTSLIWLL